MDGNLIRDAITTYTAQIPISPEQFNELVKNVGIVAAFAFLVVIIVMMLIFARWRAESGKIRVRLRELENQTLAQTAQAKIEENRAQEDAANAALNAEMVREYIATMKANTETNKLIAAAIERSNNENMANSRAVTSNTEATFAVNETMKRLPDAIDTIVKSAAQNNLTQYSAQMSGLMTTLQNIGSDVLTIKRDLSSKIWITDDNAVTIKQTVEKLINEVQGLGARFNTAETLKDVSQVSEKPVELVSSEGVTQ